MGASLVDSEVGGGEPQPELCLELQILFAKYCAEQHMRSSPHWPSGVFCFKDHKQDAECLQLQLGGISWEVAQRRESGGKRSRSWIADGK